MPTDRLSRGFEEMIETKALIFPPSTFDKGKVFQTRATDVIITPWSKSGTTWLQQMVHGLRFGGDLDFDDVWRIGPWIEADQGWELRVFKSHYSYHSVPKGARYIVSFREPQSALVSCYRFYDGWLFEPGTVTIDDFIGFHLDRRMQVDLKAHVVRLSDFLGIDADAGLLDLMTRQ